MLRFILLLSLFLLFSCTRTLPAMDSGKADLCGPVDPGNIQSIDMISPVWTIAVRKPGPITDFSDMKGVVLSFPMRVDPDGKATVRRMILDSIQYVKTAEGELAVAAIKGQRDDGKIIDAQNLAHGYPINSPRDLIGVKIFDRSLSEKGPLIIKDIQLATRVDGLLVITKQHVIDDMHHSYKSELAAPFTCSKTFVNVCACPKFFGFCDDANYPNCATETCNFGDATCEAKVEVSCPGFCVRDGLPGFCFRFPVLNDCACLVIKGPDEI